MKLLAVLCLVGLSMGYIIERKEEIMDQSWHIWKSTHSKSYVDLNEEKLRYNIWQDNLRFITEYNRGSSGVFLKMNHFGDLTNIEFRALMNGYAMGNENRTGSTFLPPSHVKVPDSVDWRKKRIRDTSQKSKTMWILLGFQYYWILGGQHFKKTLKLVSLSEQQLVDCSRSFGNLGCNGGLMDDAFKYIKSNKGIDTEKSYSYKAKDGRCHFNPDTVGATVTGFVDIKTGDEDALKQAVATNGPISVAIDASHSSFQFYNKGVYNERRCSSTQLDHGVLAVGYGTTSDGEDYWLVKNSWGESWGLEGYIMMSRNKDNQCGIATKASYPLV